MKNNLFWVCALFIYSATAQVKTISRDWTSFVQSVTISTKTPKKFKLVAKVKVAPDDNRAWAGLWARVDTNNSEPGFFDNMNDRPIKSTTWKEYSVEGKLDKNAASLHFGGLCLYNGSFWFDDFHLYIEDDQGKFKEFPIDNYNFETTIRNQKIKSWNESITAGKSVRVKEFTISSSTDAAEGSRSLLIRSSGIETPEYERGKIGKADAKNPQIDNMISMLEDLRLRVSGAVKHLDLRETDHLHDAKANRIGALVLHLAAAEVYYQKYTLGEAYKDAKIDKELKAAMDLDDEGRKVLKGKEIGYYLDIYNKVRKRTIEALRKKDDRWFKQVNPGNGISNQYAWFHVMEHQSSHLGQILFLKKRIPKLEQEVKLKKNIKS
ncbi:conserved hypothetical protein [Tenacibaculum litopenaei]|jgi:uncharacterized damage-inducible protein DinB|uniref:mycothiol transferase n=1 Tax=Tenacibaculum litopenaei TaxID=396016 RepID=UPI003894EA62